MAQKKAFGKYAIVEPVKYSFKKEPDWYWLIKPPTAKDELAVSRILTTDRSKIEGDGTRTTVLPTTLEVAIREVAVTFSGTNIRTSESDPTPILNQDASWEVVEAVLQEMPREMVIELWIAVGEAVPGWGPAKRKPEPKTEQSEETKN
jgi:hypothetical protein